MKYFDFHPVVDYNFSENLSSYEMIDIFRTNVIVLDDDLKKTHLIEPTTNIEELANTYYNDSNYFWLLYLANNITTPNDLPQTIQEKQSQLIENNKRKKNYFFIRNLVLKPGDVLLHVNDFSTFSITGGDPYCVVKEHDNILRKTTILENSDGATLSEGNTILVLRVNEENNGFILVDPPGENGVSLDKITNWVDGVINFKKNNFLQNPYLNVSGSGITFFNQSAEGSTFEKTLLYSYITDGISHSSFIIENELTIVEKNDNILLKIPRDSTTLAIEDGMKQAFNIQNSARVFTLNVTKSRLEI